MKVAIIPARGGSKRIPRKNIKNFLDKPMITWAIELARNSGEFDKIVVSSDDIEIIDTSIKAGAEVPFIRPDNISDDLTPTLPVIAHAIKELSTLNWNVEYACCIYPGSPFLLADDLKQSFHILSSTDASFVYPVTEYAHPIQRAMRQLPCGLMQFLEPKNELARTQDLEQTYHDAGQFYWGKIDAWLKQKKMHSNGTGLKIPRWRVADIDTEEDWVRAELLGISLGLKEGRSK